MINRVTIRMDAVDMFISSNRPSRDVPPRALSVGTSCDALKHDALTHDAARTPVPCADGSIFLRRVGDAWDLDIGDPAPRYG